ncbi:acyltransferase family protein [Vibrio harveyi]|uniref:acyltransferase family protein n=1 Tax=Vibrio harveyi TaxID=669 RepID=UPI003CF5B83D
MKAIKSIQFLRFIAALLVVMTHFSSVHKYNSTSNSQLYDFISGFGQSGVDIFFVISGFIMYMKVSSPKHGFKFAFSFLYDRALRIFPLYWFFTIFAIAIFYFNGDSFSFLRIFSSLLLIPSTNELGEHVPILVVGWTLILEMYFYFFISISLLFKSNSKSMRIFMISVWIFSVYALSEFFSVSSEFKHYLSNSLLAEFILGLLCAFFVSKKCHFNNATLISLLLISCTIFFLPLFFSRDNLDRVLCWGIPVTVAIYSLVTLEKRGVIDFYPLLVRLGDSSYSLYLSHFFTLNLIGAIWGKFFDFIPGDYIYILAPIISILLSVLIYNWLEKPIVNYSHQIRLKKVDA